MFYLAGSLGFVCLQILLNIIQKKYFSFKVDNSLFSITNELFPLMIFDFPVINDMFPYNPG